MIGKRLTTKEFKIDTCEEDSLREGVKTKKCSRCGEVKDVNEFYKNKYTKDGLRVQCKDCGKIYYKNNKEKIAKQNKIYYEDNKEKIAEYDKIYQKENKEKIKERRKGYNEENKEKIAEQKKEYHENNKEHINNRKKEYYEENKEHIKEKHKEYYENNKEHIKEKSKEYCENNKEKRNKYYKDRCGSDPLFRLRRNFSCLIWQVLKANGTSKKGISCMSFLDYTIEELKDHLESLFIKGMSWDNYGEWHLDHIIPKSSFKFKDMSDPEFKKCWALDNLQPLWAEDNIRKGSKLNWKS